MDREALSERLLRLSDIRAASGAEKAMRRELRRMLADKVELRTDALGNLIARQPAEGRPRLRVMVDAHMDEVSLMVVGHAADGTLLIGGVGGFDARLLPGLSVVVGEGEAALPGVIGIKPIHLADDWKSATPMRRLRVDIGAGKKDEAQRLAPLGTRIYFPTRSERMGARLTGKAFDDRVGCTILATLLLEGPWPVELYGLFSAQEEVGARGAQVAAQTLQPDVAFVLEGTIADDLPREEERSPTTIVGRGPALSIFDRRAATPTPLLRFAIEVAEAGGIPFQLKRPQASGTNASRIHSAGIGIPTLTISMPSRYIHSPVALVDPDDLLHTYRLMASILRVITPAVVQP